MEWDRGKRNRPVAVRLASSWLEYQIAAGAVPDEQIVLVADDDGCYVAATPNVERYLGISPEIILALAIKDLTPPAERSHVPEAWAAFIRAGSASGEFRLWRPDGQEVPAAFEAKANTPIAGLHVSRLMPAAMWVSRADRVAATASAASQGRVAIAESRRLLHAVRGAPPQRLSTLAATYLDGRPHAPLGSVRAGIGAEAG
jgi:PAS domain-containing protein